MLNLYMILFYWAMCYHVCYVTGVPSSRYECVMYKLTFSVSR